MGSKMIDELVGFTSASGVFIESQITGDWFMSVIPSDETEPAQISVFNSKRAALAAAIKHIKLNNGEVIIRCE